MLNVNSEIPHSLSRGITEIPVQTSDSVGNTIPKSNPRSSQWHNQREKFKTGTAKHDMKRRNLSDNPQQIDPDSNVDQDHDEKSSVPKSMNQDDRQGLESESTVVPLQHTQQTKDSNELEGTQTVDVTQQNEPIIVTQSTIATNNYIKNDHTSPDKTNLELESTHENTENIDVDDKNNGQQQNNQNDDLKIEQKLGVIKQENQNTESDTENGHQQITNKVDLDSELNSQKYETPTSDNAIVEVNVNDESDKQKAKISETEIQNDNDSKLDQAEINHEDSNSHGMIESQDNNDQNQGPASHVMTNYKQSNPNAEVSETLTKQQQPSSNPPLSTETLLVQQTSNEISNEDSDQLSTGTRKPVTKLIPSHDRFSEVSFFLAAVPHILGLGYTFAWTILYYPQIFLNLRTRDVEGLSSMYHIYNLVGFLCYAVYTVTTRVLQSIYGLPEAVTIHDVLFSVHAVLCCFVIVSQILMYRKNNQIWVESWSTTRKFSYQELILILICICVLSGLFLALTGQIPWWSRNTARRTGPSSNSNNSMIGPIFHLSFLSLLGYMKVVVTFFKYPAQILLNLQRKSTRGLSISFYVLDFCGGSCSLLQNVVSASINEDSAILLGNLPKLCLGVLVCFYDCIIFLQFWIYNSNSYNTLCSTNNNNSMSSNTKISQRSSSSSSANLCNYQYYGFRNIFAFFSSIGFSICTKWGQRYDTLGTLADLDDEEVLEMEDLSLRRSSNYNSDTMSVSGATTTRDRTGSNVKDSESVNLNSNISLTSSIITEHAVYL